VRYNALSLDIDLEGRSHQQPGEKVGRAPSVSEKRASEEVRRLFAVDMPTEPDDAPALRSPAARHDIVHFHRRSSDTMREILPGQAPIGDDASMARTRRTYDHRLRDLVRDSDDVTIATRLGVPRSTATGWLRRTAGNVVTAEPLSIRERQLQAEVVRLRRAVQAFRAVVRLLVALLRVLGVDLDWRRLPDGEAKSALLRAIDRAKSGLKLRHVLRILGLSASRYHAWRRSELRCELADQVSCPSSSPQRLTRAEIQSIREMVESQDYRHVPTGRLAVLAQRLGKVFASASTWHRLVREHKWRRPRLRVHPAKPKVGVRTERADELWHIDTTILRLVDGTKAYIHAVIDNFSRRILAWRVAATFDTANTIATLLDASRSRASSTSEPTPTVLADGGVENFNRNIDELFGSGLLRRVLAMTEIQVSNSMIEAWWRALKHNWHFLNNLDSVATVTKLVAFYVDEHNKQLPHSAFRGQTPDEMYFGTGGAVPEELGQEKAIAKQKRFEENRALACRMCDVAKDDSAAA
jgi:putative transposase